jgi:pyruvate/2-oxoglutarate dehydrogenase complex dihydrolipoamide acyltransferase (E2) component
MNAEKELRETVINVTPLNEGTREPIVTSMMKSITEAPQYTITLDADVTLAQTSRRKYSSAMRSSKGIGIRFVDVIALALTKTLIKHPLLNSIVIGEESRQIREINLGMAIAQENSVAIPIIKEAQGLDINRMANITQDLQNRAITGKLLPQEQYRNTFTISVLGTVDVFTPIINPPAVAVLGVGRAYQKPIIYNNEILPRLMTTLSLSLDHRVIDGGPASIFLRDLKRLLENPKPIFDPT